MVGRGRALCLTLAVSLATLPALPSTGVGGGPGAAVLAPYFARGPGEVTSISVEYAGDDPALLQVHVRSGNGSPFLSHEDAGDAGNAPGTFSFSCAVPPRIGPGARAVPIAVSREGSGGDDRIRISAECASAGGDRVEKRFEFVPGPLQGSGSDSGFVFVSLLDPARPGTTRIADRLSAGWSYLNLGEGVSYASDAHHFPSGSQGDAAPGADDFVFHFDGAELAHVSIDPAPGDRDGDAIADFVDLCPDVPGQDDGLDADGDGVPDACDPCNLTDPDGAPDGDADGIPDACDLCPAVPGQDDAADLDGDGVPDACDDACPCFALEEVIGVGAGICSEMPSATLFSGVSGFARVFSQSLTCQLYAAGAFRSGSASPSEIGSCRELVRQAAALLGSPCP